MPRRMNETHVRLISKGNGPRKVADYRPIALCNVFYKIIAKILTKRLQPVLPLIISESQSAFIPGRAIFDNILIMHETLHYLCNSKEYKRDSMAVKTDMNKAYDRIEWDFLREVQVRLGFHSMWIYWIMECVTWISYSFLINGVPQGHVQPTRKIRQGTLFPHISLFSAPRSSRVCVKMPRRMDLS